MLCHNSNMKKSIFKKISPEVLILVFILLIGFAIRFWRLWDPNSYIYDESYYARYANMLLGGQPFMDVHPLVGELLISLGIVCFGNNSFGWRIVPLLCGMAVIILTYFVASKLFKNTRIGLLASFLVSIDGLMIV
jgi:dolichyl-phosphate-mannose-protein mannosyltransferase